MWNKTLVTEKLGIKYPIIQGPFGGNFSSVELVVEVSNHGGLGSYGLNAFDHEQIVEVDKEIKALTNMPYALNLWVPSVIADQQDFSKEEFETLKSTFKPYFDLLDVPLPSFPAPKQLNFEDQFEAILKVKPPVMSFIFGVPDRQVLAALKKRNIKVIATATTLEEALLIQEAGVDMLVASGKEAGGHRASFLLPPEKSLNSTRDLLSQMVGRIKLPIITAGGISTGKDIATMLQLGAAGVQMGTAFLATKESNAPPIHKKALLSDSLIDTSLTKVFTGRLARAISNTLTEAYEKAENKITAPYPMQSTFLSSLRKKALQEDQLDYIACWAGQPSTVLKHATVKSLFEQLINDVKKNQN